MYNLNQPRVFTTARREKYESSKVRQKIQQFKRLIENYRRHIVCIVIFYGIAAGLFAERSYCEYDTMTFISVGVKGKAK